MKRNKKLFFLWPVQKQICPFWVAIFFFLGGGIVLISKRKVLCIKKTKLKNGKFRVIFWKWKLCRAGGAARGLIRWFFGIGNHKNMPDQHYVWCPFSKIAKNYYSTYMQYILYNTSNLQTPYPQLKSLTISIVFLSFVYVSVLMVEEKVPFSTVSPDWWRESNRDYFWGAIPRYMYSFS